MHVPILLDKCMEHMGFNGTQSFPSLKPILVVDCTLGAGGHSAALLRRVLERQDGSKLLCLDQDSIELSKAEERLRSTLLAGVLSQQSTLRSANINFAQLEPFMADNGLLGRASALLCDLGLSSMQIDEPARGFSFKFEGPLDMRMDPARNNVTALSLLQSLDPRRLELLLTENADEPYARQIAAELLGPGAAALPETTTGLSARIRHCVLHSCSLPKAEITKSLLDGTVKRTMQALRIEVNREFASLDTLLEALPNILAPGGRAVFLTFHSGEDRRVKKSFKALCKAGVYEAWSRDVERADALERRSNPRSSCCKLRWCIKKK